MLYLIPYEEYGVSNYANLLKQQQLTLFLFLQCVAVMVLVWLTECAVQVASVFAFPTMGERSVTNVHPATMDTQTVLVSGLHPSMSTSVTMIDKPVRCM